MAQDSDDSARRQNPDLLCLQVLVWQGEWEVEQAEKAVRRVTPQVITLDEWTEACRQVLLEASPTALQTGICPYTVVAHAEKGLDDYFRAGWQLGGDFPAGATLKQLQQEFAWNADASTFGHKLPTLIEQNTVTPRRAMGNKESLCR